MASSSSSPAGGSADGPAGLGQMPSMDPKCTPAKHRYDRCFNLWFEDYLTLHGSDASSARNINSTGSSGDAGKGKERAQDSSGFGFFSNRSSSSATSSSSSTSSTTPTTPASTSPSSQESRRQELRERYNSCAALFEEYRDCVRSAVKARNLEPLIAEARTYNPFPFPSEREYQGRKSGAAADLYGNTPFPFPMASEANGDV